MTLMPKQILEPKKTRLEIQCLRCVAICAVLGFHLFPNNVPQGYLGVDVFFVLSGYLMTMILNFSSVKKLSSSVVLHFYCRRLKRILPAYLTAIFFTILISAFILIKTDYNFLQRDSSLAIVFATNLEGIIKHTDYFTLFNSKKFLLHTWSLSVEVQYYFAAPFVLAWIAASKRPIYRTLVLAIISWTFQKIYMKNNSISFYSTPARLWQFLVGTLVYHVERTQNVVSSSLLNVESETLLPSETPLLHQKRLKLCNSKKQVISGVLLLAVCFMPSSNSLRLFLVYKILIRTAATVLTAYIVFLGTPQLPDNFFTRGILYLGDISYSVYLIHWPLEVFMQYHFFNGGYRHILLIVIFAISILQYELLEKNLLRASNLAVFGVCALLVALIVPQCVVRNGVQQFIPKNENHLIFQNEVLTPCRYFVECNYSPEITKYYPRSTQESSYACTYDGTGNSTVFVVGNSFALRQIHAIQAAFRGRFKKLYYMARPACVIFEDMNSRLDKIFKCDTLGNKTHVFMKEVRPDITIVIQGVYSYLQRKKVTSFEAVKRENTVLNMKHFIQLYSQYTRKLIIVEPHGFMLFNPALELARVFKTGQSLDDYYLPAKDYNNTQMYLWWRLLAAMEGCQNCMTINQTNAFCNQDTMKCDLFDRDTKQSLFCDQFHLSERGLKRVQPLYENAIDKVLYELGNQ